MSRVIILLAFSLAVRSANALDPRKMLTQYSRSTWTQSQHLPQNGIRALTQTTDGYLWIGTREGIASFDGYRFTTFNREHGEIPSNTIYSLAAGRNGTLWIGTTEGLTEFHNGISHTFTSKDGLPDNLVLFLHMSRAGDLWIVGEDAVSRYKDGKFTSWRIGGEIPMTSVREISEDRDGNLYLAGDNSIVRFRNKKFTVVVEPRELAASGELSSGVLSDRNGGLWILSARGLLEFTAAGLKTFGAAEGLNSRFNNSRGTILEDHDGNIWVGTNGGLGRISNGRLDVLDNVPARLLLEDREDTLWAGGDDGLTQLRDDVFTNFGRSEGWPSDQPSVIHEDRRGRVWVGFFDAGLVQLANGKPRAVQVEVPALAARIYSIRETRAGHLLVGVSQGLVELSGSGAKLFTPPDPAGRQWVNDAIEDPEGSVWVGYSGGLAQFTSAGFHAVITRDQAKSPVVTLAASGDGSLWAGTYDKGLWRVRSGEAKRYMAADGPGSDQIRVLYHDSADSLWIGMLDGGLAEFRDEKFRRYTMRDGLASNNISAIADDGKSLWLSTTRGITRISRERLHTGKGAPPRTYGLSDGLRSAEGIQNLASGGNRHADGSLWFATPRGVAVYGLNPPSAATHPPHVQIERISVNGKTVTLSQPLRIAPGPETIAIAFTAIHFSAPDQVRFSWKLEGLGFSSSNDEWKDAGDQHTAEFRNLAHGAYKFTVKAELPDGVSRTADVGFQIQPHYYESLWFRSLGILLLAGLVWGGYRFREQQMKARYAMVIEERARLAREVHDTLAQGFVGIASQLDVVDMCLPRGADAAREAVGLTRRMARHSLTEARRSLMDLRAQTLDRRDVGDALSHDAQLWTAGSGVSMSVEVEGDNLRLPENSAHHILRIAQEGVTNAVKHAHAAHIWISLSVQVEGLRLVVEDDGEGFQTDNSFASSGGHFGLMGMRERAQALGGTMEVVSAPGKGTRLVMTAPMA
jgi:signal transduction histidine kinase/ligand-binding sensor domain-containing protein